MGYQQLSIDNEYRSFRKDIVKTFFIPVLSETIQYKRAVGFFSSSSLVEISQGLTGLVKNNGYVQLITSPYLNEKDYDAIKKGYSDRNKIIISTLKKYLNEPSNYYEEERLNLLANLIKNGSLDIKIAFISKKSGIGIYHEKMGIFQDSLGNIISFSGSMNESRAAFQLNYETIDVYCSWKNTFEKSKVDAKIKAFNSLWNNIEPNMQTVEFPEIKEEIIKKYLKSKINLEIDSKEFEINIPFNDAIETTNNKQGVGIPDEVSLYNFQISAIDEWEKNEFKGIFDMATGTGKTFTGLGGIVRLYEVCKGKIGIVIACPFQHLVEQWVEDIKLFGIDPIIGYSRSSQANWKKRLSNAIRDQRLDVKDKGFFCFITTNATFRSDYVQEQLKKITGNALLVADEAHNFGAESLKSKLPMNFKFRLALSATLERHKDEEGTKSLMDYFGKKCIKYTLEKAISDGKLSQYYYYPLLVTLTFEELNLYKDLTRQISKCIVKNKHGKTTLNKYGEHLAIKRARVVAGAKNKLSALKQAILPHKDDNHMLIYCGTASILEELQDETLIEKDDLRQISQVTNLLGNEMGMRVSQFTSKEDIKERKILKKEFERGEMLQALIAIKCLDEGMNIPKIKIAFILASTTNPKEYIQRRGRVLRLAKGKQYATIYDFFTIPYNLNQVTSLTSMEIDQFNSLIRNELSRGYEFSRIALNTFEAEKILSEVENAYNITEVYFVM